MRRWVLIVDDHKEVRRMLRAGVETFGEDVQVVDVPSGEEALLLLSRQPIDLLVADVRLPGISGLEFIKRAQSLNSKLKRILITGVTDPEVRQEVATAGVDFYFFKPVELSQFLAAAASCLGILVQEVVAAVSVPETGPLLPIPLVDQAEQSGLLARLQMELGALAVVRTHLNDEALEWVGSMPEEISDQSFLLDLQSFLSASQGLGGHLGNTRLPAVFYMPGVRFDLGGVDGGPNGALLVVFTPGRGYERVGQVLQTLQKESRLLFEKEMPAQAQTKPLEPGRLRAVDDAAESDRVLPALDDIFARADRQPLDHDDVNAFWDALANSEAGEARFQGNLSYEEARQMGLAPEEH